MMTRGRSWKVLVDPGLSSDRGPPTLNHSIRGHLVCAPYAVMIKNIALLLDDDTLQRDERTHNAVGRHSTHSTHRDPTSAAKSTSGVSTARNAS
jgi:hypothetical protein